MDTSRLVIGWRKGQKLEGRRIELHHNRYDSLRKVCVKALQRATSTEVREEERRADQLSKRT